MYLILMCESWPDEAVCRLSHKTIRKNKREAQIPIGERIKYHLCFSVIIRPRDCGVWHTL